MNGKKILAAFIALALLGAYYWFFEVKKSAEDDKAKAEAARFFPGFDRNKITEITIKNQAGEIYMKKGGMTWYMEKPGKYECDTAVVDGIAAAFAPVVTEQKIDGIRQADFGFKGQDPGLIFKDEAGKKYEVIFGMESPASLSVYVARPGETGAVYLIPRAMKDYSAKTIFDLRYKKALKIPDEAIDKISVSVKGKGYTLVKASGVWRFEPDTREHIKADRVSAIINSFRDTVAKSMEAPGTAGKYGVSCSSETVDFYFGKEHARVTFGREDNKKYSVYAKNSQMDDVLELPDFIYMNLPQKQDLVDKRIAGFEQQKAWRLEANYGDKSFIAEKQVDSKKLETWKVKSVKMSKDEEAKINAPSIVSALAWLEYAERINAKPEGNQEQLYGFVPGNNIIRVLDDKNALLAEFDIGKKANKQDFVYVKTNYPGVVYLTRMAGINILNIPGMEVK